ncbi:MAG: hypothetical protein NC336_06280 [Clostridium sp.]|nr:hypothetical protein [Clostridium sp.]
MRTLVDEPGFANAVKFVLPDVDWPEFREKLLSVGTKEELQQKIMYPFLEMLASKTTSGISSSGTEVVEPGKAYTFITNHRDIVLDASFLNLCFLRDGKPTSEIAIGNNLLIYDWISDLVRLNKSFIVKRNLPISKSLEAAMELSAYIHYAIGVKHESVWIAQREGRAKDSNDVTQESLLKMLAIAGEGDFVDRLIEINLSPVAISYEYDPNDYLKAREFLLKRLDANFRKSQRDDLFSMETGLLQPKGRVYFALAGCVNDQLDKISRSIPRPLQVKEACAIIDRAIHSRYHLYPINYVAYDLLKNSDRFAGQYTPEEKQDFISYVDRQLDKVDIEGISELDRHFMREKILAMYANPLKNKISSLGEPAFEATLAEPAGN